MSKSTIVYDVRSVPNSLDMQDIEKLRTLGYIFYDSEKGETPFIMVDEGEKLEIINSNSEEGKKQLEQLNK